MKIGLICEYNPFHNGHLYQIEQARKKYPDSIIIAVVTNYFSMRGDVSVLNKYDKTKVAILNGVNLVVEFPYLLATQSADIFASNAVQILNAFGVDVIISGSESNNYKSINNMVELEHDTKFQELIYEKLKAGNSYRSSYSFALKEFGFSDIGQNDVLNVKYLQAIKVNEYNIKLELIQRVGSNYLDEEYNDTKYQSASALRANEDIKDYVPDIVNQIKQEKGFYSINAFSNYLKFKIISGGLKDIYEAKEGIENRFDYHFNNVDELIQNVMTKRYLRGRVTRFVSYIITDYRKSLQTPFLHEYRVLGFDQVGKDYLNKLKHDVSIITNAREGKNYLIDFEFKLAKIFSVVYGSDFVKMEQQLPYIKGE